MKKIRLSVAVLFAVMLSLSTVMPVIADDDPVCEPADVVLVIDRSGSMSGSPLTAAKNAAKYFVDLLNMTADGDNAAEVSFASTASMEQGLTDNATLVKNAIDSISASGLTCIGCGINIAQGELDANGRADTNHVIVLLSDGVPTAETEAQTKAAADAAKAKGTIIFSIGIGGADADLMEDLATKPAYFSYGSQDDLDVFYEQIALDVCNLPDPQDDVPEFGTLAAIGILAAAGLFIYRRRK